jgi:hypothetical protein
MHRWIGVVSRRCRAAAAAQVRSVVRFGAIGPRQEETGIIACVRSSGEDQRHFSLTTDMTLTKRFPDAKAVMLTALMVASTAMNVILSLECAHLREIVRSIQAGRSLPKVKAPPFNAKSMDGSTITFAFPREMLILYAFSPTCVWSRRNHPNAVSLSKKLGSRADFVAVSLIDSKTLLETYVTEHRSSFPVLFAVTPALKKDLQMGITPQLLVLSPVGELLKVWSGPFVDRNREEIETFLHIKI